MEELSSYSSEEVLPTIGLRFCGQLESFYCFFSSLFLELFLDFLLDFMLVYFEFYFDVNCEVTGGD